MRVVIYESSAFGGNFNYATELFRAYQSNSRTKEVVLLIPSNAAPIKKSTPALIRDRISGPRIIQQLFFLWRNLVNPFILFFYLLPKKSAVVIMNDFEQLTAPLWVPLFRIFLSRHSFAVFLHDPDRDNYPPSKSYSIFSMRVMMSIMKFGFYHEHLPMKRYYQNSRTKFIAVPHGIYSLPASNIDLQNELREFKKESFLLAIIGNIRLEKNYEMAIRSLSDSDDLSLVIAGSLANSSVDLQKWKQLANEIGVESKIFWCVRYLNESELATVITLADCILLNYSPDFTSQSGVLNTIAPFRKKIIVSNTSSSLTAVARRFQLGEIIRANCQEDLKKAIQKIKNSISLPEENWSSFLEYASWTKQVEIVLNAYDEG